MLLDLLTLAVGLALAGVISLAAGIRALGRRRVLRFTLLGLLLVVSGRRHARLPDPHARGRRRHVTVRPAAEQQFAADVLFPDGRQATFALTGDQIYAWTFLSSLGRS